MGYLLTGSNYFLNEKEYSNNYKNERFSSKLFEKKIWRVKDVAEFLGCSQGHVYNLTSDEKIPKVKKGKFVYFIPELILNWVMEGD